jgi:hypothetical protein
MQVLDKPYKERIGYARGSLWAPFHAVGMVARIQGDVPPERLQAALRKLQVLYPPLACRIQLNEDGSACLTSEGVEECRLWVRPMTSYDDWAKLFLEQEQIPFTFDRGPIGRFFLLRGGAYSDLMALAPHVICDGYAMSHVITDAVALLNDPQRTVVPPTPSPAINWQAASHSPFDHLLLRGAILVINRLWPKKLGSMDQENYEDVHQLYWSERQNNLLAFELSPAETADLLDRCRQRGVTINSALVAAFLQALAEVRSDGQPPICDITVAVNIRNRLIQPPGRVLCICASNLNLTICPGAAASIWELTHQVHKRIYRYLNDRVRPLWPLALGELKPAITDRMLAALSTGRLEEKLGLLARFLKIGGMHPNLDVSNIGRLDLPEMDGLFRLQTILPLPPLAPGGGLALNVLTVNDQMNVILKYRLDQLDGKQVSTIRDLALSYLSAT